MELIDLLLSPTGCDFAKAIHADLTNMAPRLIFADWLQEQDAKNAQTLARLLRTSIREASLSFYSVVLGGLAVPNEIDEMRDPLSDEDNDRWFLECLSRELGASLSVDQGLLGFTGIEAHLANFKRKAKRFQLLEAGWVGSLSFRETTKTKLTKWLASDFMKYVLNFSIYSENGDDLIRILAESKQLANVEYLNLRMLEIGDSEVETLSKLSYFPRLQSLDLSENRIGDEGLKALSESKYFPGLRALYLGSNGIGSAGLEALAKSSCFPNLQGLDLRDNRIGDKGLQALAKSSLFPNLSSLVLSQNPISEVGANAFVKSSFFSALEYLELREIECSASGLKQLEKMNGSIRFFIELR